MKELMDVIVVGTTGRVVFTETARCMQKMIRELPLKGEVWSTSPYWNQALTSSVKQALTQGTEFLLFFDGDAVWDNSQVMELFNLISADESVDAVCPVQADRNAVKPLVFDWMQEYGMKYDYTQPCTEIIHGHFGMSMIRSRVFRELPEPWFWDQPAVDGSWDIKEKKQDADTYFWVKRHEVARTSGLRRRCLQANHVVVGHMELVIRWQRGAEVVCQTPLDFQREGKPYACRIPYQDELEKVSAHAEDNLKKAKKGYEMASLSTKTALKPIIERIEDCVNELNCLELHSVVKSVWDMDEGVTVKGPELEALVKETKDVTDIIPV